MTILVTAAFTLLVVIAFQLHILIQIATHLAGHICKAANDDDDVVHQFLNKS
jgi:hypothetical protein